MAKNGTRCRPFYEDQNARISILANDILSKGRIRFRRLLGTSDTNRLPTGRAIRFEGEQRLGQINDLSPRLCREPCVVGRF